MKTYFNVSFKYSDSVYCANVAHAESPEEVEKAYRKKYSWVSVSPANEHDVEDALKRGKPIIEVEPEEAEEAEEAEEKPEEPARARSQIIDDILAWFDENPDTFTRALEELDAWDGYLGDDRYYPMEELAEFYADTDPLELLNRAYYGWDEDSCTIDQWGTKRHDAFCPNRDYFRYNGYGNLVSTDYPDYSDHLDRYAVEAMERNRGQIDTLDDEPELSALFDELENAEN